jgi:membrane dipeptidase
MDRRHFVLACLAAPFACSTRALAEGSIYIGDMHYHLFFVGPRPADSQPLGASMAAGNATLVAWSLVGDQPWLVPGGGGFKQKGAPKGDEARTWLRDELKRVTGHLAGQKLKIVKDAGDIDSALDGYPHVVLSVEGATFADNELESLEEAYELGIRQVQLVHYIRNPLGDFQTSPPTHDGLTDYGKKVLLECNRLGILVDLAHCTTAVVTEALAIAKAPLIWSHSSVAREGKPTWTMPVWKARQLELESAKAIAAKGGVVGLWALGADVGSSVESYAKRIREMADLLGPDHVAFGTDMNALSKPAIKSFADLRRVVDRLQSEGVPRANVEKIAIGNYARVLRAAFEARQA